MEKTPQGGKDIYLQETKLNHRGNPRTQQQAGLTGKNLKKKSDINKTGRERNRGTYQTNKYLKKEDLPKKKETITKDKDTGIKAPGKKLPRQPRWAAVTVTIPSGAETSYEQIMGIARDKISLAEMEIEAIRPKKSITGGLILEIPGENSAEKAAMLSEELGNVAEGVGVRVQVPVKKVEIIVKGLMVSTKEEEVAHKIAEYGECDRKEINCGNIRFSNWTERCLDKMSRNSS